MPAGGNYPKVALALAAVASALFGLGFGLLVLLLSTSGSPDFRSGPDAPGLLFVLAPIALSIWCVWLLRRSADTSTRAGGVRAALTAFVWLIDLGLALALGLYLLSDHDHWLLVAAALLLAFGCAYAISRSFDALVALTLTAVLAVAVQVSGALEAWLT